MPPRKKAKLDRTQFKVFNDPIHGHIELHPLCVKIIDTPQFQRLRYLKQMGGKYFVYPGASHNRFEHCIGVCHLAGQLAETLQSNQPKLKITEEDVLCVKIAGLCHDLGHGPFSHAFELFMKKEWKHEDTSRDLFDHLVQENGLKPEFEEYGLSEQDLVFIKEQITGIKPGRNDSTGRDQSKSFLYDIVANKRNGIDVDKWDYFARDCHHLGMKSSFDHGRLMKFSRALEVDRRKQICFRDKEVNNLYDMFHTRASLHRRACQHKTAIVIEDMIAQALRAANEYMQIAGTHRKPVKMSDADSDMVAYTRLTDNVYHQILHSTDDNLKPAREILEKIERRELPRFLGQTNPKSDGTLDQDELRQKLGEIVREQHTSLQEDDFLIQIVLMDYGMKEKDPISNVRFYTKTEPDKAFQMQPDQCSQMLPKHFSEKHIFVYCKKTDKDIIRAAKTCFVKLCKKGNLADPVGGNLQPLQPE